MEWLSIAVLLLVTIGACAQVLTGVGFALVCSPLLILTLGRDQGIRTVLLMSILLNGYVLFQTYRSARAGDAARLLIPAAIVVVPTLLIASTIRTPTLTLVSGIVIVVATALVAVGRPMLWLNGNRGAVIAGAFSGIFNALAAAAGPPVTLFAAQRRWTPNETRGTLQLFGLPLNLITLALLGPFTLDFSQLWWAVIGLFVGTIVGSILTGRVPEGVIRPMTLLIAALGGLSLIANGVASSL
jgi:uncharacterized membrane protein YfcA